MSTLQSVDVSIDGLQNDSVITAKDYPPVVDHASVMRWNSDVGKNIFTNVGNNVTGVGSINGNVTNASLDIIKGQMVAAEMRLDAHQAMQMDDLELKNILVAKLVRELMNGRYIEFTKQEDLKTMETVIRARIYVTPDEQVRVIRKVTNG